MPLVEPAVERAAEPAESVATRVVSAVASREGVDPTAIEPPLYDAIDPDALDALVASNGESGLHVSFTYCGYPITVDAGGGVSVGVRDHSSVAATGTATD
jgi:hypothetical protein